MGACSSKGAHSVVNDPKQIRQALAERRLKNEKHLNQHLEGLSNFIAENGVPTPVDQHRTRRHSIEHHTQSLRRPRPALGPIDIDEADLYTDTSDELSTHARHITKRHTSRRLTRHSSSDECVRKELDTIFKSTQSLPNTASLPERNDGTDNSNASPKTTATSSSPTSRTEDYEASVSTASVNNTRRVNQRTALSKPFLDIAHPDNTLPSLSPDPIFEANSLERTAYSRSYSSEYEELTYLSGDEEITLNTNSGDNIGYQDASTYEEITVDSKSYMEFTVRDDTFEDDNRTNDHVDNDNDNDEEYIEETIAPTPPPKGPEVYIEIRTKNMAFDWSNVPELKKSENNSNGLPQTTHSNSLMHSLSDHAQHTPIPSQTSLTRLPKPERKRSHIPWLGGPHSRLLGDTSFDHSDCGESSCSDITSFTSLGPTSPSDDHTIQTTDSNERSCDRTLSPLTDDNKLSSSSVAASVYDEYTIDDTCSVFEVVSLAGGEEQVRRVADLDFHDNLLDDHSLSQHDGIEFDLSELQRASRSCQEKRDAVESQSSKADDMNGHQPTLQSSLQEQESLTDRVPVHTATQDVDAERMEPLKPAEDTKGKVSEPESATTILASAPSPKRKSSKASKWKDRVSKARQRRAIVHEKNVSVQRLAMDKHESNDAETDTSVPLHETKATTAGSLEIEKQQQGTAGVDVTSKTEQSLDTLTRLGDVSNELQDTGADAEAKPKVDAAVGSCVGMASREEYPVKNERGTTEAVTGVDELVTECGDQKQADASSAEGAAAVTVEDDADGAEVASVEESVAVVSEEHFTGEAEDSSGRDENGVDASVPAKGCERNAKKLMNGGDASGSSGKSTTSVRSNTASKSIGNRDGLASLLPNQVVASTLQSLPGTEVVDSKPMLWSTVSKTVTQEEGSGGCIDDHIGVLLQKAQTGLLKKTLAAGCNVVLGVTTSIATDARGHDVEPKTKTIIVTLSGTPCRVMPTTSPLKVEAIPV